MRVLLTAAYLKLASMRVQWIVIKVHLAGDGNPHTKDDEIMKTSEKNLPQLIGDGLVLDNPHSRHLLQHPLASKSVKPVYLQLRVPNILQNFWRLIHFLHRFHSLVMK